MVASHQLSLLIAEARSMNFGCDALRLLKAKYIAPLFWTLDNLWTAICILSEKWARNALKLGEIHSFQDTAVILEELSGSLSDTQFGSNP